MKRMALVCALVGVVMGMAAAQEGNLADVIVGANGLIWQPLANFAGLTLTVAKPDGETLEQAFPGGSAPYLNLSDASKHFTDGEYTWELRAGAAAVPAVRDEAAAGGAVSSASGAQALVQSGSFLVSMGGVVDPSGVEPDSGATSDGAKAADGTKYTYNEDLIVTGGICAGGECQTGELFGNFNTIKLKYQTVRLAFDDTSSGTFPANDWRLVINDSVDGGANYFAVEDATGAKVPFKIAAGARNDALYVSSTGKVGIGTATPSVDLHLVAGDTPELRFAQDTSGGFSAYAWDVAGNESNFFVRDTTAGSHLCFRIQPGAPENALTVKADGKIGIGTWTPGYAMECDTTGKNAAFVVKRTDGAANFINATDLYANFGAVTNHPLRLLVNSTWRLRLNTDNSLSMFSGASCTVGGVWTNASSRELKQSIQSLTKDEAVKTLEGLNPVKFAYKADKEDKHVGFIAEDVPELVASKDRKGMSPMDVTAVLTKVVQEQQKTIAELKTRIEALEKEKGGGR